MSRHSQPKPLPDCRKCQHRGEVVKGLAVECGVGKTEIPWDYATNTNLPCPDFRAGPRRKQVAR